MSPLYQRIKDAFNRASDVSISKELKISRAAVSQWKTGDTAPSDGTLLLVAEITGKPYKWLKTGESKYLSSEDKETSKITEKTQAEQMSLERFVTELQSLGVEDFNPAKSLKALTPADMEEILAVARSTARSTAQTMIKQRVKAKQKE